MDNRDRNSWDHRKDFRSDEEAKTDLKELTRAESWGAKALRIEFKARGRNVTIYDHGMDNTGEWVSKADQVNGDADLLIVENGNEKRIELKLHSEIFNKTSLKEEQFDAYIRENAYVFVLRETRMFIISSKGLRYIREHYEYFPFRGMGDKDVYQFFEKREPYMLPQAGMLQGLIDAGCLKIRYLKPPTVKFIRDNHREFFPKQYRDD